MTHDEFVPLDFHEFPPDEMQQRATDFYAEMRRRRTVRAFSDRPVPAGVVEDCLRTAGTAPSGANLQPWHFVVVTDPAVKQRIRTAAEAEEQEFYSGRGAAAGVARCPGAPLDSHPQKPFLDTVPHPIAIFAESYGLLPDGPK